ncbi:xylitol oxidase [Gracilibacillus ureilyticus]|uniref:Xylitol oxidase n=1 Tax=Gracilibacillus ureilyticus TaxID=531814 RepID=A0A1H9UA62_9BACI|nr:FAD-binding protein [Gracilibacillus ureilyticus]SES06047.1 xylitol oxidase [Gracilibacillus ureilyticus]
MANQRNWAGNYIYSAENWHSPESVEEIQQLVKKCKRLKVVGSRHSFNDIADSTEHMISLEKLNKVVSFNKAESKITIEAGMKYSEVSQYLEGTGLALHNLASLPHISVAGACATATHGSGDKNGNLATIVDAMEFVNANGEVISLSRENNEEELKALVVSLGALGIITKLTLNLVPDFQVRQDVYENLTFDEFEANYDAIFSSSYSVSLFTDWGAERFTQVWLKRAVTEGDSIEVVSGFFGAKLASVKLHPIAGHGAEHCTDQLGIAGPWHDRLSHFRMNFTPSSGKELQSEYIIPRENVKDAVKALGALGDKIAPLLLVSEIRSIAADDLWMSMNYKQDSIGLHFTWKDDWSSVKQVLPEIEAALEPFHARPHWGKLFTMAPERVQSFYEKLPQFRELVRKYDPDGKFRNAFLDKYIF